MGKVNSKLNICTYIHAEGFRCEHVFSVECFNCKTKVCDEHSFCWDYQNSVAIILCRYCYEREREQIESQANDIS